ncbi:MAG: DNA-formamidopyrimidine glycosylase [Candidatus Colwellbacteria bacterium]|jgi:formamidopyrimidine-DNA glycosylase|nr:DNA-formamidopyrimidine glycosylase [Candidatus Colwellbacteria bacterium]MCK9497319.1 DNA-formamidopyrimidine glycosylase [Candidatus Colwellbacteria bacterium]MDD3752338.1 DNA-formamidopyrimidine glycosylase [Candidatus Colwellbacteria bacterium]MDD4818595.1 DNA-formamidopyrimidine glycosylase [Candidatus Colwellbacteria bacterium]
MPELPEVENTVKGLKRSVKGSVIKDVWTNTAKLIREGSFESFKKGVKNKKITGVRRRAKNIIISLENGYAILIHLKMTGHLLIGKWKIEGPKEKETAMPLGNSVLKDKVNGYIHFIFYLNDGRQLAFSDLRKFGKLVFGKEEEILKEENIGIEAPDISLEELRGIASKSSKKIKTLLMDQSKIAGIGNIYSDDILFKSGIHPLRKASSLSDMELKKLHRSIGDILNRAIKLGGSSISDYRDIKGEKGRYGEERLVYQRDGELCPVCSTVIEKTKVGGRTARFCPKCQPANI